MGFFKKLLGGGDKSEKATPPPPTRRSEAPPPTRREPPPPKAEAPKAEAPADGTPAAAIPPAGTSSSRTQAGGQKPADSIGTPAEPPDLSGATVKDLIRLLGTGSELERVAAAEKLALTREVTAVRPLMTSYLNYGDAGVLEAMRTFGSMLTPAATRESSDLSIIGPRRSRLLDILGASADPEALGSARDWVKHEDHDIKTRACDALVRMGDMAGIDVLSSYLKLTDVELRVKAIDHLRALNVPLAKLALDDHVERYLAEAGAIPQKIEVSVPRLTNPEVELLQHITDHIKKAPHALTVAIGSGAVSYATNRSMDITRLLEGYHVHLTNRRMPPEEQIQILEKARDEASSGSGQRSVLFGILPSPHDSPPLPNFLFQVGHPYNAKVIVVDPHEYNLIMDWWREIEDSAQVPTDFEVILSTGLRDRSAISEEEVAIYEMTPDDQKAIFARALLAHM